VSKSLHTDAYGLPRLDPGADLTFVRVRGDMDEILRTRIDTLLSVLADVRPSTDP